MLPAILNTSFRMLIDLIPKHTKDETFLNADPKHVLPFVAHTYASADSLKNVEVICKSLPPGPPSLYFMLTLRQHTFFHPP